MRSSILISASIIGAAITNVKTVSEGALIIFSLVLALFLIMDVSEWFKNLTK